ncbi:m-AAA protease subunit YTA12 KNAG_0E02550 [Huiozyma naganishii CBS 8797]|uniref:AAA+ ATPase domain-containing protein n=1 Tax=Huiozyma naganishii (strain ATCC MYA-139 / BCRC 22969 / CBS 8797 / KCTC 17520 / NBRC 10181 / NCYC 3082 / Yp74L-3) TaxID=1071383 RepID=J7S6R0_HUIN7|nr:hypothetical protein KNAG_0E02550 [Kazachstania naganishii CBS 8797]CCK70514.1 hypothetical protein KNAG_0E02550 [Kazachstania naganishii CBS 8797]
MSSRAASPLRRVLTRRLTCTPRMLLSPYTVCRRPLHWTTIARKSKPRNSSESTPGNHNTVDSNDEDFERVRRQVQKYFKEGGTEMQRRQIDEELKKLEDTVARQQKQEKDLEQQGEPLAGEARTAKDGEDAAGKPSTYTKSPSDAWDKRQRQKAFDDAKEENPFFTPINERNSSSNGGNKGPQDTNSSGGAPPPPPTNNVNLFQLGLTFFLISLLLDMFNKPEETNEISWQDFYTQYLSKNYVTRLVVVNKALVKVMLNEMGQSQSPQNTNMVYFTIGSIESFEHKLQAAQDELNIDKDFRVPVIYLQEGNWGRALYQILPTALMIGGIIWLTRKSAQAAGGGRNGIFGLSRSKAKQFNTETAVKVKFKDVAGCDEAKEEIMEFVSFLKEPSRYEKMGAKIPRGAILSGPPGTGKTLLAKATAGEAGVPFYFVSGSEFVEMFVGVGAARVRDLFKTARENAPSIVFIDEIDAIGKARQKGNISGANDERENTLNQMLVEMDGFTAADHVVVLAGTNRPDILDKALLRPGRFDRHINLDNPELSGRKDIFAVHLQKLKLAGDIYDLKNRLAALTPGFSGADIANVCNEAALIAARNDCDSVKLVHFEQAIERVIGGVERKSRLLSPEEKKTVAYHEAGHAVCGWYLKYADPLLKVSIIPRGQGALGYAQYLPGDIFLLSEQQLKDRMTMALGGRVSEELHFESVTSGASDDFKKVTGMAQAMVTQLGMSPKIGWINYQKKSENDLTKPFSEETGDTIDSEIYRIVQECHERCTKLLKEKSEDVEKIAQLLLKKEVLTREDMIHLLGKRPFPERNDAFDKYLNETETERIKKSEEQDGNRQTPDPVA